MERKKGPEENDDFMKRTRVWILRIAVFIIAGCLWEAFAHLKGSILIPGFLDTLAAFTDLSFGSGALWTPLLVSNQAMVIGFGISATLGVALGLAMARSKLLDGAAKPYMAIWVSVPLAPLIPLVVIALGLTLAARVFIVVFFSLVFVTVNTRAGVRSIDQRLVEMARSFGASEAQIWKSVLLPGAVPGIFAGLRIGLARAITGMIVVELLLVAPGIGALILEHKGRFEPDYVFAIIGAVVVEAILLVSVMQMVERRAYAWAEGVE